MLFSLGRRQAVGRLKWLRRKSTIQKCRTSQKAHRPVSETACRLRKTRCIFASWDTVHSKGLPKGANRTRDLSVARVERFRCRNASSSNDRWATSLEELVGCGVLEVLHLLDDKSCLSDLDEVLVFSCCLPAARTRLGAAGGKNQGKLERQEVAFGFCPVVTPLCSELGNLRVNSAKTCSTPLNSESIQTSVCFPTAAADGLSPRLPSRVDVTCDIHRAKMQRGLDAGRAAMPFDWPVLIEVGRGSGRFGPGSLTVVDCWLMVL